MKTYEITYITAQEETADAGTIAPALKEHEAKIVSVFPWDGRRKLVYPIKKQDQGFYTTVVFESETSAVAPIERALSLNEAVLRSIIVEFEPGMFHRTPETTRPIKEAAPVKDTAEEKLPAETPVIEETATPAEEKTKETEEEKPKRKRATRKTTEEETKALDETLDELLKEDITA